MSFFATPTVNDWGENVFKLSTVGFVSVALAIGILIALGGFIKNSDENAKKPFLTKHLIFCSMAMALAVVTSELKFARLPMGGSITLFSMLFIVLIGYWYGPKIGILTGLAYGLLQFILDPVFYSIPQLIVDYPLAFGALGLSGFFSRKKHGLIFGYIAGVLGRYFFAILSGIIFFAAYTPEGMSPIIYSISYNASYIIPEAVATVIVVSLPVVNKALSHVRNQAISR